MSIFSDTASFATQKFYPWVVQEADVCSRCPAVFCSWSTRTVQPSSNESTRARWGVLDLWNSWKCQSMLWDVLLVHNTLDPVLFGGVRFTAHASQIFWACAISMRLPGKIYLTEQFLNVTHAPCWSLVHRHCYIWEYAVQILWFSISRYKNLPM